MKNTSVVEACRSLGNVVKCSGVKAAGDKTRFDLCNGANSPLSSELVYMSCQLSPVADPTIVLNVSCNKWLLAALRFAILPMLLVHTS